jgi:hypothetical protein
MRRAGRGVRVGGGRAVGVELTAATRAAWRSRSSATGRPSSPAHERLKQVGAKTDDDSGGKSSGDGD